MSTEKHNNGPFLEIKKLWPKYETKIILIFAFVLVAILAFQAGVLKGQKTPKTPLIIEKTTQCDNIPNSSQDGQKTQNLTPWGISNTIGEETPKNCQFLASKNSDKYHKSSCALAKKIKPENKVCFFSEQEAMEKGFKKAGCCLK